MWTTLKTTDNVAVGDKIRFLGTFPGKPQEPYTVVKSESHYFQILPEVEYSTIETRRKVVKYHDLGYYLKVAVWK